MSIADVLSSVGIKVPDLAAGFGGGAINALWFQRGKPLDVVSSVVGGAITANFLTGTVSHVSGLEPGAAGFLVGLTAMVICQGLFVKVRGWFGGPESDIPHS
jgi:hypothetical protein